MSGGAHDQTGSTSGYLSVSRTRWSTASERRFRGHRANSFQPVDNAELVELRARQRTFDGAYARTALGQLCYAIVILRLFQPKFFYVGELQAVNLSNVICGSRS